MRHTLALLCAVALFAWASTAGEDEAPEIRIVENFVPYEEFLNVVGKNPSATIMTLEEYRALVTVAMGRSEKKAAIELPPIRAQITEVVYEGVAQENAVRFDAKFKVHVAGKEWVRCPLGAISALGSITLEGKSAWVVDDGDWSYLLLKGEGAHTGTVSFSVPLQREEDTQKLEAQLLLSAASVLHLSVPGRVTMPNATRPVTTEFDAATNTTRLSLALGQAQYTSAKPGKPQEMPLRVEWKRGYDSEKNPPLLFAEQKISYLLERASPLFHWTADVTLARRKTDELTFTEPAGLRLVRLVAAGIHSWHRDGSTIRVLLNEPTLGRVQLAGSGVFVAPPGDFELRCYTLNSARQDTRTLIILEPPGAGLSVSLQRGDGLRELTLPPRQSTLPGNPVRAFLLEKPDSVAVVRGLPRPDAFESQTAAYLLVDEQRVLLRTAISLEPIQGRLYSATLTVPAPWKLTGLRERSAGRGLRADRISSAGAETWQLTVENAAVAGAPLELDAQFGLDESAWSVGEEWAARNLKLVMPSISGARRNTLHLGLSTHPSIDVAIGESPLWRTQPPGALSNLGFPDALLRAGLWTEQSGAELSLGLARKVSRGEYEAVTHLLAQEREAWVRCDLRLTVVDRALEELTLSLPAEAKDPLYILGPDIKETLPGANAHERRVRFNQPWLGVRTLRIEYRAPLSADTETPIPVLSVLGRFDARRSIVFQGAGVVELAVTPGTGLQTGTLEDVPDFAKPFKQGRSLFAYSISLPVTPGTYRTRVFEKTPTLRNLARDMKLVTVLDAAGVSRTHASFVLAYARQQYVQLLLPQNAKLLALSVEGQPAQPVKAMRPTTNPVATGAGSTLEIPLPPKSLARIEFVYECSAPALGLFGSWNESAPELVDIPVSSTSWNVYYPPDYDAALQGGNLIAESNQSEPFFALSFFGEFFSGRLPRWTAWESTPRPALQKLSFVDASSKQEEPVAQSNQLQAVETRIKNGTGNANADRAVGSLAMPEGAPLASSKIGGVAHVRVVYTDRLWRTFAPRVMFLFAVVLTVVIYCRFTPLTARNVVLAGLVLGTLIPVVFNWHSPLLLVPFCEGLSAVAIAALLIVTFRLSAKIFVPRSMRAVPALLAIALTPMFLNAGEASSPVLIPYEKGSVKSPDGDPKQARVYVPESVFKNLMSLAHPEKKDEKIDAPFDPAGGVVPYALGDASYELVVTGETFALRGTVQLATFHPKGWAKIPLIAAGSFLSGLTLDGQPATIGHENGQPFAQIFGAGQHVLGVEFRGPVTLTPGRASLNVRVIPGSATRVKAILPPGVDLDTRRSPSGSWIMRQPERLLCEFDLDARQSEINLVWQSPDIRAKGASQLSTRSYSHFRLGADGFGLVRFQQVTINGSPQDQLTFTLSGEWDIASVSATDLAAWTVSGEGAARTLQLWYQKPIVTTLIEIAGWTPLASGDVALPNLSLQNALRQEGYVGLEHGAERRFTTESPTGLKRSSLEELSRNFALPPAAQPDRIYHWYEPPAGSRVAAEIETHQVSLETQLASVVLPHVFQVYARSRYTATGRLPLRHEVDLPANWEIRSVRGGNIRRWDILQDGAQRRLSIEFSDRDAKTAELLWSADVPFSAPAAGASTSLNLPLVRAVVNAPGGVRVNETTDWVLATDESLALSQSDGTTMLSVPIDRAPAWVKLSARSGYRIAFRSNKPDSRLVVDVLRQESVATATAVSFIRAADEFVQVNLRVRYRIDRAGMDRFTLRLPPNAALLSLDARNMRSSSQAPVANGQGNMLVIQLQAPAIGEQFIDLAYRFPRSGVDGVNVLPVVLEDANIRKADHFVGLLQLDRGLVMSGGRKGLLEMKDREELPFLPNGVSAASLAEAFVAEPEWSFTLRQPEVVLSAGPSAEVALAVLKTVIANDGGVRNAARYRVRNRSLQFIRIALPLDAKLWGIFVDGQPASVSSSTTTTGEAVLQIPIPRMSLTDLPSEILVVYESAPIQLPAALTSYTPRAPRVLDMTPVETYWEVYIPDGYEASRTGGNVHDIAESVLVSGELKTSIAEGERLVKLIENPETPTYQRQRALRNIARNRQELSDNVTVLNQTGQSINDDELKRVGREELQSQLFGNNVVQQQAATLQDRVGKYGKDIDAAVAGAADPRQQQMIFDNWSFLSNQWRDGAKARKPELNVEPARGEVDARELGGSLALKGFKSGELPGARTFRPQQQTEAPNGQQGLRDETALFVADAAPADLRLIEQGAKLTFRRVEGHPELSLSLRSRGASWQYGALTILIGLGVVAVFLRFRKRKA